MTFFITRGTSRPIPVLFILYVLSGGLYTLIGGYHVEILGYRNQSRANFSATLSNPMIKPVRKLTLFWKNQLYNLFLWRDPN